MVKDVGRAQGEGPPLNERIRPGNWPKDIRFADIVVVQPILCPCFIVISGQDPVAVWNRDAILPLDVPLAMQRSKGKVLAVRQVEQRAGGSNEWRSLVIVPIEALQDPVQPGNLQSAAKAWIGRGL